MTATESFSAFCRRRYDRPPPEANDDDYAELRDEWLREPHEPIFEAHAAPKPRFNGARRHTAQPEPEEPPVPNVETAASLLEQDMPEITYLCDPWAPEGLNLIAGRPKLGKTTLLRQKMAAVAGGESFFGESCRQGEALFLCLEEGRRMTRRKLELAAFPREALERINIAYEWPRGEDGLIALDAYLDAHPTTVHVGVDSLTKFRTVPDPRTPAFMADYLALAGLQAITKRRHGLCVDVVHHTRKLKSDDPIDDVSGTYGLTAACDSYWVMRHHEDGALLHVGGRLWDREQTQYQLRRERQRWQLEGVYDGRTERQDYTVTLLVQAGGMGCTELAKALNITKQAAHFRLQSLVRRGLAYAKGGVYYATK